MTESESLAATRLVYDRTAARYVSLVGTEISPQFEGPLDRAVLAAFAEIISAGEPGPVLDIGCGPGRVTAFLAERGLRISGIDLSPEMIAGAREAHPDLLFEEGSLIDLPVDAESLAGAVCWYSIIHTPLVELGAAWRALRRALRPGGTVLLAFQAGENERIERSDAHGSKATLVSYRHAVDDVASSLEDAGFRVTARATREAALPHEITPQAFLFGCVTKSQPQAS